MATQLQLRRGTTTEHSTFVGAVGEVTVDTTKDTLVVHDGATTAGFPLAKESTVTALDSAAVHKTGDETIAGTKTLSSNPVLSSGTANGVAYLNGSKVLTTGSALTFDGANLGVNSPILGARTLSVKGRAAFTSPVNDSQLAIYSDGVTNGLYSTYNSTGSYLPMTFYILDVEQMRLTSTGLGIGTSSPAFKLDVFGKQRIYLNNTSVGNASSLQLTQDGVGDAAISFLIGASTEWLVGADNSDSDNFKISNITGGGDFTSTGLTLTTSGNLGLGVTPSAWNSYAKALQVGSFSALSYDGYTGSTTLTFNAYQSGTTAYSYLSSGVVAARYSQLGTGGHAWYNAPSGTAGNAISFTQAMTLDASGNLMVGTSTAPGPNGGGIAIYRSDYPRLSFRNSTTGDTNGVGTTMYQIGNNWEMYNNQAGYVAFGTNAAERMRIDANGRLFVNQTAVIFGENGMLQVTGGTSTAIGLKGGSNNFFMSLYNTSGSLIGSVTGSTGTTTSYNTSSDYRLKENIQPMQNALGVVAQLNPVTYTWKADGSDGQGFIAHELQAVVPDCVTGEKDAVDEEGNPVYQGIDTSFLVATLTKAIQELNEKVTQQAAEIAALKGA